MDFLEIGLIELIDIALVAVLIYQLYKLVKGTVAINIFIGLAFIYLVWKVVSAFHFQLLSEILGQFIGVGVIILVIVFQQELRKFLMLIGKGNVIRNKGLFRFNFSIEHVENPTANDILELSKYKELEDDGLNHIINTINEFIDITDSQNYNRINSIP